jgi:hypothetical protein
MEILCRQFREGKCYVYSRICYRRVRNILHMSIEFFVIFVFSRAISAKTFAKIKLFLQMLTERFNKKRAKDYKPSDKPAIT